MPQHWSGGLVRGEERADGEESADLVGEGVSLWNEGSWSCVGWVGPWVNRGLATDCGPIEENLGAVVGPMKIFYLHYSGSKNSNRQWTM